MKRGVSSANAVPGTVSSMTAQGVLPNYAGYATASLTPTIANTTVSPKNSATKQGDAAAASPGVERRPENQPPNDIGPNNTVRHANMEHSSNFRVS